MNFHQTRWTALVVLLTAVFMDMVDNQIVSIALPTIQKDLAATPSALQWTASGYTLAFALTLITGGRLGDRFGHRALFVLGTSGFGAASLAAGLAPNVPVLIAARVAQGVFAGLMVPQVLSFIRAEFPAEEQGRAMGFFGMTFPIGGIAGPLLGGVLTQADLFDWHWRTIFFINVPVAVAATIGATLVMPKLSVAHAGQGDTRPGTQPGQSSAMPGSTASRGAEQDSTERGGRDRVERSGRGGTDVVGVLVLAAALLAVLFPLVQGRELGWPAWVFALMGLAVPLLVAFVAWERGRAEPLVRPEMFRSRALSVGLVVMLVFYCGMGAFFVLTLHLQNGLGYSPMKTALTMLPATVGIVAGNGIGMPLAPKLGRRLPMVGLVLLLAGTAWLIAVVGGSGVTPWQFVGPVILFGAGLGLGSSSLMLVTLSGAGTADAGAASGVVNTVVQLGIATGPATVGTVFFGRLDDGIVTATRTSLVIGIALFAVALAACFLLPRRLAEASPDHPAASGVRE